MNRVKVYSTGACPICEQTKKLLTKWNINYDEARIDINRDLLKEMLEISNNARMVPQIAFDGEWIGGFTELTEMHMEDKLDHLMES